MFVLINIETYLPYLLVNYNYAAVAILPMLLMEHLNLSFIGCDDHLRMMQLNMTVS